jgi:hypothetical protein
MLENTSFNQKCVPKEKLKNDVLHYSSLADLLEHTS